MNDQINRLRLTWLVPDDAGGGVVSVAQACCRQAALAGHDVTLLMLLPATGHAVEFGGIRIESLNATPPYSDAPRRIIEWLRRNPQDVVFLNGCEQADVAIPHVPGGTRIIYVVHDAATHYFQAAIRNQTSLDAIIAVSKTAASFRHRLLTPEKLHVALNGTIFPISVETALSAARHDDLVFLGGDNYLKGSYDVLHVWAALQARGYAGRLHWFGHIGEEMRTEVAKTPGAERVLLHGRQPRLRIFETAMRSRVILMLSRADAFGMVTVECMGMGCLTAAWDINSGTREIVAVDECAFAPLGDYERLADGIVEILARHEARYRTSTLRIRSAFDDGAMWARYRTVLDWVNERAPASRPLCQSSPPQYRSPARLSRYLPAAMRRSIRNFVGRSPRLEYVLRGLRGQ